MLSFRWLVALAVPVVVPAALVTGAATAATDAADDIYPVQLHAAGFSWLPDQAGALTAMGRLVCDDLSWGWTYDHIARGIHANLDHRNVTVGDAQPMVSLAHRPIAPIRGARPTNAERQFHTRQAGLTEAGVQTPTRFAVTEGGLPARVGDAARSRRLDPQARVAHGRTQVRGEQGAVVGEQGGRDVPWLAAIRPVLEREDVGGLTTHAGAPPVRADRGAVVQLSHPGHIDVRGSGSRDGSLTAAGSTCPPPTGPAGR